jgi:serine/threonine protein kinase
MSNPKRLAEGSYGCVHNPPLKCKNKPYNPDPNKVSKILTKKHANSELKEFKLIQSADKQDEFHLGNPTSCFPDNNEANQKAINTCRRFSSFDIDKYKLLILKNGGKDLSAIQKQFGSLAVNNANRRKLENFWLDMSRIIYGSKVLMDNGIVHHDIKQQNIVYNEKTGRVNFIDFGLMTTTKKMFNNADVSRYPYPAHWSFPPEILFYNKSNYKSLTSQNNEYLKSNFLELQYEKYADYSNGAYDLVQNYLKDIGESYQDLKLKKFSQFFYMSTKLLKKGDDEYKNFLNKSFETFDNYAIGFSLFSILKETLHLINDKLFNDLSLLFLSMVQFNVFARPSPSEVVEKYEFILKSNGLLDRYKMRFKNHLLVDGTEKKEQEIKIEDLRKDVKKFIDNLILKCPDGKERNPKTKRCINKCKEGYSRNADFKCNKNKTKKNVADERTLSVPIEVLRNETPVKITYKKTSTNKTQKKKVCIEGKELNPITNRCNTKCKDGYSRNTDFKCKKIKIF